jgi:hypothetical protein
MVVCVPMFVKISARYQGYSGFYDKKLLKGAILKKG